jgi:hypothetical protein
MSTYREIRSLTYELGGSKMAARRAAGEKLIQMLSLPEVRNRLMQEASTLGGTAGVIQRRKAIAEMWRFIIQNAIVSVQTMVSRSSKQRLTLTDIGMPYKLLRCSHMPYEITEDSISYEPPKLSRKVAKMVFTFCYDMLQEDVVLPDRADAELLSLMAYICNRREFLAYMRPHLEVHAVIEEVEKRLIGTTDGVESNKYAAQVWENVLVTCTRDLGVGLHLLMPGCVKIMATWCQAFTRTNRIHAINSELPHLLKGLTALLMSDPEQAVAPLTRHGRHILSLMLKDQYFDTDDHRQCRYEYFMAHL